MKKYYRKLVIIFYICLACSLLIITANGEQSLKKSVAMPSEVVLDETDKLDEKLLVEDDTSYHALILYSPLDEVSEKYERNLKTVLKHLRISSESVELSRADSVSYSDYDLVILASAVVQKEMDDPLLRLLDYVDKGGKLFWGILPEEQGSQFKSVYRRLGMIDYGEYLEYDTIMFEQELIPGITGMEFSGEAFGDVGLSVTLEDAAEVYAIAKSKDREIPLVWSYQCGQGQVSFFNGTGITGDYWRGIAAGCINSLFDTTLYPVINASCLYIDDFPSPQYESTSDVVRNLYNRSVKEFYRDIWWPDMQKIARKYDDKYTGLFMATYNDIVEPDEFTYEEPSMEQYYGNSLLKSGYEMGAHGYNHQSLTLEGGTPEEMGYNPWENEQYMEESLKELLQITEELFPSVTYYTYVPPSNYLSEEGREAVKNTLPDLKVISGTYSNEGESGDVYVQDFEIAEDGIAEFPRITSGMIPEDFDTFTAVSGVGLYGVFSHFIHPDDIFDEERGKNLTWEKLYEGYCDMMDWLHDTYAFLRPLTAAEAADALKVADQVEPYLEIAEEEIVGSLENFYGEAFFYLKTDKKPVAADDSCSIEQIDPEKGSLYYIVTVKRPNFKIKLVDK